MGAWTNLLLKDHRGVDAFYPARRHELTQVEFD